MGCRLANIMQSTDGITRKTKIVCTIGPACWSQEKLGELIDAGMNIARLNFSHGDHKTHAETLVRLRGALACRPHKNVSEKIRSHFSHFLANLIIIVRLRSCLTRKALKYERECLKITTKSRFKKAPS